MSEAHDRFLAHRIRSTWQWMQDNFDDDDEVTEEDALDYLREECGQTPDGGCLLAGSEQCDFECPFRDGLFGEDVGAGEEGEG